MKINSILVTTIALVGGVCIGATKDRSSRLGAKSHEGQSVRSLNFMSSIEASGFFNAWGLECDAFSGSCPAPFYKATLVFKHDVSPDQQEFWVEGNDGHIAVLTLYAENGTTETVLMVELEFGYESYDQHTAIYVQAWSSNEMYYTNEMYHYHLFCDEFSNSFIKDFDPPTLAELGCFDFITDCSDLTFFVDFWYQDGNLDDQWRLESVNGGSPTWGYAKWTHNRSCPSDCGENEVWKDLRCDCLDGYGRRPNGKCQPNSAPEPPVDVEVPSQVPDPRLISINIGDVACDPCGGHKNPLSATLSMPTVDLEGRQVTTMYGRTGQKGGEQYTYYDTDPTLDIVLEFDEGGPEIVKFDSVEFQTRVTQVYLSISAQQNVGTDSVYVTLLCYFGGTGTADGLSGHCGYDLKDCGIQDFRATKYDVTDGQFDTIWEYSGRYSKNSFGVPLFSGIIKCGQASRGSYVAVQPKEDSCSSSPCKNGGACSTTGNSYSCTCPSGYTGRDCGTNVNDCLRTNPCQNGGTCTDGINSYTCSCPAGFTGDNCEININECNPNPCQNEGICTDGVNSYTCACPPGYEGYLCEIRNDFCPCWTEVSLNDSGISVSNLVASAPNCEAITNNAYYGVSLTAQSTVESDPEDWYYNMNVWDKDNTGEPVCSSRIQIGTSGYQGEYSVTEDEWEGCLLLLKEYCENELSLLFDIPPYPQ